VSVRYRRHSQLILEASPCATRPAPSPRGPAPDPALCLALLLLLLLLLLLPLRLRQRLPSPLAPSLPCRQHLMREFEDLSCDVVAVSADTRGKACSFVSALSVYAALAAASQPLIALAPALQPTVACMHTARWRLVRRCSRLGRHQHALICKPALASTRFNRHLSSPALPFPPARWMTCVAQCWQSAQTLVPAASASR
jgi:hypothetical protein